MQTDEPPIHVLPRLGVAKTQHEITRFHLVQTATGATLTTVKRYYLFAKEQKLPTTRKTI